jgi:hypothetical protein
MGAAIFDVSDDALPRHVRVSVISGSLSEQWYHSWRQQMIVSKRAYGDMAMARG